MKFDFLKNGHLKKLFGLFEKEGAKLYVVGGAIRNSFVNRDVSDIDLVTNMLPEKMVEMFDKNKIKYDDMGINFGTIRCLFADEKFEITTLRQDKYEKKNKKNKIIFSRYPRVKFVDSVDIDARRRDFTVNAIYVDKDGSIIDPLGGMKDLENGVVKFIGNPLDSIMQDPLRILRYFRFCAEGFYKNFDDVSLAVCVANFDKTFNLSKRKFAMEYNKIIACRGRFVIFNKWEEFGILNKMEDFANKQIEEVRIEDAKRNAKRKK